MKCPACKKDLTEDFKTAYKLGVNTAEIRYDKTLKALRKANKKQREEIRNLTISIQKQLAINRELFAEMTRLDRIYPLPGISDYVTASVKILKGTIHALRSGGVQKKRYYITALRKILKEQAPLT